MSGWFWTQVLNDLLDPSRANLKLREDPKRGFYVEGIKEETLVSAEHALSIIAMGVAHRKVNQCDHSLSLGHVICKHIIILASALSQFEAWCKLHYVNTAVQGKVCKE